MMQNSRILVVDDDRSNCAILSKILSSRGYRVDVASSGEEALQLLEKNTYGLALLDYMMPGMDGVEVYRRMRQLQPEVVAVFQTAFATIEVIYSAIEAGAERVLAKPVDTHELLPLVERLVGAPPATSPHAAEKSSASTGEAQPGAVSGDFSARIAAQIRDEAIENLVRIVSGGRPTIERRLQELDREWDLARAFEAQGTAAALVGLSLGATVHRKWLLLPALAGTFLLQHALQGWCAPMSWLRHWKYRTSAEIARERYALKALRGDFRHIGERGAEEHKTATQAFDAAEA
jgi:CheY-like chemotaxis protein